MKTFFTLCLMSLLCMVFTPVAAVNSNPSNPNLIKEVSPAPAEKSWKELSRKERRAVKKEVRKKLKTMVKEAKSRAASDTNTLLLVIIAILIPFLAMAIYDGITNRFWISLLLTLLFYLPGLIYTLVIILGEK